ncbi:hypothetical protein F1C58_07385 [Glaciihabitans sp. INWT7]|uniref:hypothetical protein n=1 Tax=Glaciihabitans sp. INWT7 TaxID=2596912 RepID=UPI00162475CE|nr:hypothetical protein [Glaciihabitans sp. INWT7]QNE46742.1 hypothetical protein F1C58_07385 [Glaciihabitans sp. INWT7]
MKPHYEDTVTQPLTSDELIHARVSDLVGRACRRQIWFLFLDGEDVQLPLIIPVADPPVLPDDATARLADTIAQGVEHLDARSVILVLERYAGPQFSSADKAWARALGEGFAGAGLPVRATLVSHSRGVRWFAADDFRWDASGEVEKGAGTREAPGTRDAAELPQTRKIAREHPTADGRGPR